MGTKSSFPNTTVQRYTIEVVFHKIGAEPDYFNPVLGGDPGKDVQIPASDHHVDILGKALVAMIDCRQPSDDCQGDLFFA